MTGLPLVFVAFAAFRAASLRDELYWGQLTRRFNTGLGHLLRLKVVTRIIGARHVGRTYVGERSRLRDAPKLRFIPRRAPRQPSRTCRKKEPLRYPRMHNTIAESYKSQHCLVAMSRIADMRTVPFF